VRNRALGFIYQFHHLLPEFTAWRTSRCRSPSAGWTRARRGRAANGMLARVGLEQRVRHLPASFPAASVSASHSPARW
jgi:lipoprotein-releasing system ATP-binding protein